MTGQYIDGSTTDKWLNLINEILRYGEDHNGTREILNKTFEYETSFPVINCTNRGISYKFMAAEADTILRGTNDASELDDSVKHFSRQYTDIWPFQQGAYGPMVVDQLPWVVRTLIDDRDSRQAVLSIWRPRPARNPDIPCTLTMQFLIREDKLHTVVNMRSSDAFMGLIYDTFVFAQISRVVAYHVANSSGRLCKYVELGKTYINAGSSHIYEDKLQLAEELVQAPGDIKEGLVYLPDSYHNILHKLRIIRKMPKPLEGLL